MNAGWSRRGFEPFPNCSSKEHTRANGGVHLGKIKSPNPPEAVGLGFSLLPRYRTCCACATLELAQTVTRENPTSKEETSSPAPAAHCNAVVLSLGPGNLSENKNLVYFCFSKCLASSRVQKRCLDPVYALVTDVFLLSPKTAPQISPKNQTCILNQPSGLFAAHRHLLDPVYALLADVG